MNEKIVTKFINKTIDKTKSKGLKWRRLPSDFYINPLPSDKTTLGIVNMAGNHLLTDYSYIASYKTGTLLLLTYSSLVDIAISTPPDNCTLSLRMQDNSSRFAVEITNSTQNSSDEIALIRLFNLIDKDNSSVNELIHDFLDS